MATRKPDRSYSEASEDACMDRSNSEGTEGQEKEVDGNYITHEAVEGRTSGDCIVNEVTATNNKTSAERNVEGQTGQNTRELLYTEQSEDNLSSNGTDSAEQSEVEKLNTFPQRMLLCSRCQAALRHKNIVRRISTTENWTGACSICKHLLYVGEYEVIDKTLGRTSNARAGKGK